MRWVAGQYQRGGEDMTEQGMLFRLWDSQAAKERGDDPQEFIVTGDELAQIRRHWGDLHDRCCEDEVIRDGQPCPMHTVIREHTGDDDDDDGSTRPSGWPTSASSRARNKSGASRGGWSRARPAPGPSLWRSGRPTVARSRATCATGRCRCARTSTGQSTSGWGTRASRRSRRLWRWRNSAAKPTLPANTAATRRRTRLPSLGRHPRRQCRDAG